MEGVLRVWEAYILEGLIFRILRYLIKNTLYCSGFSIEGGTRRLIAAYFGIYSHLLCV